MFVLNNLFNVFATLLFNGMFWKREILVLFVIFCDKYLFIFGLNSHLLQSILLKKFKLIIFSIF